MPEQGRADNRRTTVMWEEHLTETVGPGAAAHALPSLRFNIAPPGSSLYPGTGKLWWEHITSEQIQRIVKTADDLGYDFMTIPTHLAMAPDEAKEMGPRWVDSLTMAGFMLGATRRIVASPLVLLPLYNPVYLAKALATLDYASGGRMAPLMLLGYKPWEYEVMHVPFEDRGAIMDEHLEVMRLLWTEEVASFDGRFTQFPPIMSDPHPYSDPAKVWIGGRTKAAMRRVAKYGDGYIAQGISRAQFTEFMDYVVAQPEFQARPRPLDLQMYLFEGKRDPVTHEVLEQPRMSLEKDFLLEQIDAVARLGTNIIDASSPTGTGPFQNDLPGAPKGTTDVEDYLDRLRWFAETIMPEARRIKPANILGL